MERISRGEFIIATVAILASGCRPGANDVIKPPSRLGNISNAELDRLRRLDLEEAINSSIRSEYLGERQSIRSENTVNGVKWSFALEHSTLGQKQADYTDVTVNVTYGKGPVGEDRVSQYIIQVAGLDQISKGNLKNHFNFNTPKDDPSRTTEKSITKSTETTPGRVSEQTIEKTLEKPIDDATKAVDLLKAAGKIFYLPFSLSPSIDERPQGVNLLTARGRGKTNANWDVEVAINTLGYAEYKVTKTP